MHKKNDVLLTSLTRDSLLKILPKGVVGVEVGVNRGAFAGKIHQFTAPRVLHLIDPWPIDSSDDYMSSYKVMDDMQAHYEIVVSTFKRSIDEGRIVIHRKYSYECEELFPDGSLDFVYIDGMHSYEACLQDLKLFGRKLKGTGMLLGHDFSNTAMGRKKNFGVVRAVSEYLTESDFMPVLVTMESAPSYMLTRHGRTRQLMIERALESGPGIFTSLSRLVAMEQVPVTLSKNTAQVIKL